MQTKWMIFLFSLTYPLLLKNVWFWRQSAEKGKEMDTLQL